MNSMISMKNTINSLKGFLVIICQHIYNYIMVYFVAY